MSLHKARSNFLGNLNFSVNNEVFYPILMSVQSNTYVYGMWISEIAVSHLAMGMEVCLLCLLCVMWVATSVTG
jgi:hypothetical protein